VEEGRAKKIEVARQKGPERKGSNKIFEAPLTKKPPGSREQQIVGESVREGLKGKYRRSETKEASEAK